MEKAKHIYGAFCFTTSRKMNEIEGRLVNRLNAAKRNFGEVIAEVVDQVKNNENLSAEDRKKGMSFIPIFKYFLDYERIDLWNPIDEDGNPIEGAPRLLSDNKDVTAEEYLESDDVNHWELDDVQKLRVHSLTGGQKLGISIFRMAQILFGVSDLFVEDQGLHFVGEETAEAIQNGEHDEDFLRLAKEYHSKSGKKSSKKTQKDDTNVKSDVPTIDDFEAGDVKPSDLDVKTLNEFYQITESSGKKAAITRELNKREQREAVEA